MTYVLRWEIVDETNTEVETLIDVIPIGMEFDTIGEALKMKNELERLHAKPPVEVNPNTYYLRAIKK